MFLSYEHDTLLRVNTTFDETMVAVTAAEMRKTLGLMPWPVWETHVRARIQAYVMAGGNPYPDFDRGTGRSTRGALMALAQCRVWDLCMIHVAGKRHAFRLVKDLAAALKQRRFHLSVEVVSGDPDYWRGHPGGVLFHQDHFEVERYRRHRHW